MHISRGQPSIKIYELCSVIIQSVPSAKYLGVTYLLNLTESSFSQTTKANLLGPPFQPAKICLWQDHPGDAGQGGRGGQTKQ